MNDNYTTKLDDEIDILEVGMNLFKYKNFIIGLTSFFAVSSVVIALTLPVTYKSSVLVIESEPSTTPKMGGMASLVGIDIGGGGASKTAIALQVLKTRKFFNNFDNKRNVIPLLLTSK